MDLPWACKGRGGTEGHFPAPFRRGRRTGGQSGRGGRREGGRRGEDREHYGRGQIVMGGPTDSRSGLVGLVGRSTAVSLPLPPQSRLCIMTGGRACARGCVCAWVWARSMACVFPARRCAQTHHPELALFGLSELLPGRCRASFWPSDPESSLLYSPTREGRSFFSGCVACSFIHPAPIVCDPGGVST